MQTRPISNQPQARKTSVVPLLRCALSISLLLIFCLSSAEAQNSPSTSQASDASTATGPAATTRSRRVAENEPGVAAADANQKTEHGISDDAGQERLTTLRLQIETAKTENERSRRQRLYIDYLVALGKTSEAIAELRIMSRAERLDPIGFYNIGNALARLGDTDTAIDSYRKAIKQRHDNYARAHNNLGVMLLRQGRWDEAQKAFATALKLENFRYGEASYNLGRVYASRGEADLAIREWTRSLTVEPDHVDAAIALARAYAEDGSPERGVAVLDAFVARRGPSAEVMEARRAILFSGDTMEVVGDSATNPRRPAKTANESTSGARPSSSAGVRENVRSTATVAGRSNSKSGGRAFPGLRSLKVDSETYDLLRSARSAREKERNEEAVTLYQRVLSRNNGFFPPANLELGFVLSAMRRHEEAAAALAAVARREGERYPIAYYHLARQYEQLGQLSLAAESFENAAAAYGDENPQFLLDVSRVREKEGNAKAALAAMESYLRISQIHGRVPDWSAERVSKLREKAAPSSAQTPVPQH